MQRCATTFCFISVCLTTGRHTGRCLRALQNELANYSLSADTKTFVTKALLFKVPQGSLATCHNILNDGQLCPRPCMENGWTWCSEHLLLHIARSDLAWTNSLIHPGVMRRNGHPLTTGKTFQRVDAATPSKHPVRRNHRRGLL